jgi:hypothetical protein
MSAKHRSPRHDDSPEVTAQPKSIGQELRRGGVESGLSVDAEDLGKYFLSDATAQDNFESSMDDTPELSLREGPPSDEALIGPTFESDHSVWESTIDLSLQNGVIPAARRVRRDTGSSSGS